MRRERECAGGAGAHRREQLGADVQLRVVRLDDHRDSGADGAGTGACALGAAGWNWGHAGGSDGVLGCARCSDSGGATASTWTSSAGWTQQTVSFTTGSSGTVTVYVHGWYAQGNVYADDFSVS